MSGPFIRRTFNISQIPEGKFVKTSDVAKLVGVNVRSLKNWIDNYDFPESRISRDLDVHAANGQVLFLKRDELIAWFKRYGQ